MATLTFYTKEGADYVPSITQSGESVILSTFPCGDYESNKFFFVSGVPKETISVTSQSSDWFSVSRSSIYGDTNEQCFQIIVQQNAGFERVGSFTVRGDHTEEYTVTVRQEASNDLKVSGMSVFNATCECADGSCDISEYHYSCSRESLQVHATLPERGQEGTTYFVGSHTTGGFEEYVWSNASGWVKMGVAAASLVGPASSETLGLVKVSNPVSTGADVGLNGNLQLKVPMATNEVAGAVKLGSQYKGKNAVPYRVGITVDDNFQLVFNLRESQSDGSAGCLKYIQYGDKWEMGVAEASASQMGIVKLAGSIAGLSDSEVESMRNTHAASVGLLLDSVDSAVRSFVTSDRISGYFSDWALGSDIPAIIWTNYQSNILNGVGERVLASDSFQSFVSNWIEDRYTDEKFVELFGEPVKGWAESKAQELAADYWNKDIENTIKSYTDKKVVEVFPVQLGLFLTDKANVSAVANAVKDEVKTAIASEKDNIVTDYLQDVMDGKIQITVGGVATSFPSFVESKVDAKIGQSHTEINNRLDTLEGKVSRHNRFEGLTKTALMESAEGKTSGVFTYTNNGYKMLAIKCAQTTDSYGGKFSGVLPVINISECITMGIGTDFVWRFDGNHSDDFISGIVKVTSTTIEVQIIRRHAEHVACNLTGIYAWN